MRLLSLAPVFALPLLIVPRAALAQGGDQDDAALPITRSRIGGLEIASVRPGGALIALGNKSAPALELEGSREDWDGAPQVLERVQDWVRHGGVVILHTDAAQEFGFSTSRARLRTHDQAGQLFGRARSALHFGLHPLLWNGLSGSSEGAAFGSVGTRLVFYRMAPGDCFAMGHPDGVPILRATDLALPVSEQRPGRDGTPIQKYASALAPFGRGWALVLPRVIETQRADGQAFEASLGRLLRDLSSKRVVGVPTPPIERAYDRWMRGRRIDWARIAAEVRRGVADEEVEASPEDVSQVLALDADQTLSRKTVDAHFGPVRAAARSTDEADYFFEVANALEGAKRRRLMFLAQSRFRLLASAEDLERTLQMFDAAARDQAANQLRAEKLPVETGDGQTTGDDPEGSAELAASSGLAEDVGEAPVIEDERFFPSYRAACGRMFLLRTQIAALRNPRATPDTNAWSLRARRLALEPSEFWLWRGIMAAGEVDDTTVNSWLRALTLGDAAASWQRALAASWRRTPAEEGEAANDQDAVPSALQLFGGEAETANREKVLAAQAASAAAWSKLGQESQAQVLAARGEEARGEEAQASQAASSPARSQPTLSSKATIVGGVPREVVSQWISGALAARAVLQRDAPLGASLASSRIESIKLWGPVLDGLNGGLSGSKGDKVLSPLVRDTMRQLPDIPRRGWLEDSRTLTWYRQALQAQAGLKSRIRPPAQVLGAPEPAGPPDLPVSNTERPELIAQAAQTLRLHSGSCAFGWSADAEDITMCPSVGAMRSLASGIVAAGDADWNRAAFAETAHAMGLSVVELEIRRQMEREQAARVRASLPPRLALPGVRYIESANTGLALGSRILIPTAPDPPQAYPLLCKGLSKRQIRMMIGIPTALARSHADVLINTITEGGTAPPPWMREGFVALSRQYMARAMSDTSFLTNGYFQAIPFSYAESFSVNHGTQIDLHHNYLDEATDPDANEHDIWWAGDNDYFNTCSQIAMLGVPESLGANLLPRLYKEVGAGVVTEIMQRLGSGASADEAFEAVTGYGADEWASRQVGRR